MGSVGIFTVKSIYFRYVTMYKYETRTRQKRKIVYQCCPGYKQNGDECPIGVIDYS